MLWCLSSVHINGKRYWSYQNIDFSKMLDQLIEVNLN